MSFISCFLKKGICDSSKVITYSSTNKSLQNDFKFAKFVKIHDKYLNVKPFKTLQAKTYKKCLVDCAADQKCTSFNFAKLVNSDGLHLCEMLDTDQFNATLNSTEYYNDSADHQHFTRKTECLFMPCRRQNPDLLCLPDYVRDKYVCKTCKEVGAIEGLSEWSEWSGCDRFCDLNGKKRRKKTCNTKAVCNPCNAIIQEEQECHFCPPESPIRADTAYGYFCVQPKSGDCNPTQDTVSWNHGLEWKSADKYCSAEHMKFLFDASGRIYHKCSGKIVCEQDLGSKYPPINQRLILTNSCPDEIAKHKRRVSHSLEQVNSGFCVHSIGGIPGEGRKLVYLDGCDGNRLALEFFKLPAP
ncbi:uncharacterized protein LOC110240419 [Exaiptasia diaphana]|uniref:Apple domain-containing protein n=1 Tax=Exaiptasia diaphana TaxID=2652724 RepID=A0A913YLJ8_EXADI|nr:uncharacterized protein LOC110240419 [Exaiptasia diaphana]